VQPIEKVVCTGTKAFLFTLNGQDKPLRRILGGEMDSPLVVAPGADRRVLKEPATFPFSSEATGSHRSEVLIRENPPI